MDKAKAKENIANAFTKENIAKAVFIAFAAFSILAVFIIIGYLLYASIPAFNESGFFKFIFEELWSSSSEVYGVARMIVGTLVLTLCSVLIGGSLAIFTAVWLVFYCPKKLKKIYTQLINLLAGIPSIVYGLFGYKVLIPLLLALGAPEPGTGLLTSTIVLSVMILPTITSITKNSLESVPLNYYEGALALGCTKNQAVWRVLLPAAKSGIIAALILGIGRAVGETMAVQMLIGNGSGYPSGLFIPFSTLSANIVQNWGYAEVWNGDFANPTQQNYLFADGFVLLIIILILNVCLFLTKKESNAGNHWFSRRFQEGNVKENQLRSYRRTGSVQDVLWIISWIIAVFVAVFLFAIIVMVLIGAFFPSVIGLEGESAFSLKFLFGESSNAQITLVPAMVSTLMLILLALLIALPLGVGAAIFLNEYSRKGSKFVKIIRLFVDTLSGIPSIVFGIFGYVMFASSLGMGYSLGAGGITLSLIILPTIIRSTEQALSEVPDSMREASYALGAGKVRTIFLVVLPQAIAGIITAVILSIGRIISESAALIFTVGSAATFVPTGYGDSCASLAVLVWRFMSNGLNMEAAFATAAVLLILVIILNLLVTVVELAFKRRNKV